LQPINAPFRSRAWFGSRVSARGRRDIIKRLLSKLRTEESWRFFSRDMMLKESQAAATRHFRSLAILLFAPQEQDETTT
jgi:hypothetical protein